MIITLASAFALWISAPMAGQGQAPPPPMPDLPMPGPSSAETPPLPPPVPDAAPVDALDTAATASRTIAENTAASAQHSTLSGAISAAGLGEVLSGPGPFTLFAPVDAVFDRLGPAEVATLMEPANRERLAALLTYHAVPERITAEDLAARIAAGGGSATMTSVQGGVLTATMDGDAVILTGMNGGRARVTQADVMNSNGVTHVIDGLLVPSM